MIEQCEISIRPATNDDCERVKSLLSLVLSEYGLEYDPEKTDSDINDIETNYIERGGLFEILEDTDGNVFGTVGLFPIDKETIELRKMYFDKRLRGRGFGKKTLERMIEKARELGFKKIYLETAGVLREAIGLYEKYGFQPTLEGIHSARCDTAYFLDL